MALRVHFDGGHKDGRGSGAWTLEAAHQYDNSQNLVWRTVAEGAIYLPSATSVFAELVACSQAVPAIRLFLSDGRVTFQSNGAIVDTVLPELT